MKKKPKQPKKFKGYECYPWWTVLLTNIVSLSVYAAGAYLLYLIWPWLALIFIVFMIYLETSIYREGCVNCYYYGRVCAFGRGKIAKVFLKKGNAKKFCEKEVGFKDFIPYSIANFIPLIAGIYLLILDFRWWILAIALWPLIVLFFGNPILFGELACKNCRQAEICCPVCQFFMKREKKKKR
jgi:hypothetical protein